MCKALVCNELSIKKTQKRGWNGVKRRLARVFPYKSKKKDIKTVSIFIKTSKTT